MTPQIKSVTLGVLLVLLIAAGYYSYRMYFPSVDVPADVTRQRENFAGLGFPATDYTLYNASANVSYGLDVFGETRREIEAAAAQAAEARIAASAASGETK